MSAIAVKPGIRVTSDFSSEGSGDYISRLSRIINAAFQRTLAAEEFLEKRALKSASAINRSYLLLLSEKKAAQRVVIDKISKNFGAGDSNPRNTDIGREESTEPYDEDGLHRVFETVYEKTIDELDFYINFLLIEHHPIVSSLLLTLVNLSKDFLFEVKIRYLEHQSKILTVEDSDIRGYYSAMESIYN